MRMLVFPYGHDCEPIIRHADMLDDCYDIVALVSPGGWGLAGKNITVGSAGNKLTIHETFEEVTEKFDSLFIPSFETSDEQIENRIIDKVITLIPRLSHILCVARLTQANRKKLKESCRQNNPSCDFMDFCESKGLENYDLTEPAEKYPSLQLLDVPVVVIAGMWEKTDKFEISLSLRERFQRDGYKVSQIGSRDGCGMLGFHSFPRFMFQKDLDGTVKIPCFNRWIQQIVKQEQPDLVLITVPGALQDFNEQFTRGFGLLHHEVFQAVVPDALVMCTFYMNEFTEGLEKLSLSCKYRFDTPVDIFHMSNLYIDITDSEEFKRIITNSIYRRTVSETIDKKFKNSSIPIFNGLELEECDRMYEVLLEKLVSKDIQAIF